MEELPDGKKLLQEICVRGNQDSSWLKPRRTQRITFSKAGHKFAGITWISVTSLTAEEIDMDPLSCFFFVGLGVFFPSEIILDLGNILFNSDCIFFAKITLRLYSALDLTAKLVSSPSLWLKLSSGLILF